MEIKTLREWLLHKEGQVSTATRRPTEIGELMEVVELIIKENVAPTNTPVKE